jgi:hypothetical protein
VYEYRQLRAKEKAMTRTLYALAIAVVCAVFSVVSGTSQAAPIAPLSAVAPKDNGSAMLVSWHDGRGGDHRKKSGFRRGGIFAYLGRYRSLLGMLAGGQGGGGIASMLGGMGGTGNAGGFASMLGGMVGTGNAGGFASMLGGMGGGSGAQSTAIGQVSQSARQACTPDALRLCSDYIPDVGRITACMRAKSAQLSTPCRAAMNAEGARLAGRGAASPARGEDVASYGGYNSAANFGGGQNSYEAGPGYDSYSAVQNVGNVGGFDIGRIVGMARSFGFSR